jgi:hypothetical protein
MGDRETSSIKLSNNCTCCYRERRLRRPLEIHYGSSHRRACRARLRHAYHSLSKVLNAKNLAGGAITSERNTPAGWGGISS